MRSILNYISKQNYIHISFWKLINILIIIIISYTILKKLFIWKVWRIMTRVEIFCAFVRVPSSERAQNIPKNEPVDTKKLDEIGREGTLTNMQNLNNWVYHACPDGSFVLGIERKSIQNERDISQPIHFPLENGGMQGWARFSNGNENRRLRTSTLLSHVSLTKNHSKNALLLPETLEAEPRPPGRNPCSTDFQIRRVFSDPWLKLRTANLPLLRRLSGLWIYATTVSDSTWAHDVRMKENATEWTTMRLRMRNI
jgi:hypothetical protein